MTAMPSPPSSPASATGSVIDIATPASKPNEKRRRNGKKASCEPCRKGKIRCDHVTPVCGRCVRRGIQAQCFVHAAPMTRSSFSLYRNPDLNPALGDGARAASHAMSSSGQTGRPGRESPREVRTPLSPNPARPVLELVDALSGEEAGAQLHAARMSHDESRVHQVAAVILLLQAHFHFIKAAVTEYHRLALASLTPGRFTLGFIDALPGLFQVHGIDGGAGTQLRARALAAKILHATQKGAFAPRISTTVAELIAAWSGENTRLAPLGLICTISARAVLFGTARDDDSHDDFIATMLEIGDRCVAISRELSPRMDDVQLWQGYDNTLLLKAIRGDWHPTVWTAMGNLISDSYNLGVHREHMLQLDTPFFLADMRRKCFAKIYWLDKVVSSWLDRPPRMLRRYSDTKMPLDLSDMELLGDESDLDDHRSRLTPDGWNPTGNYMSATWARARYTLGPFREQILEYAFFPKPLSASQCEDLRQLATQTNEAWESIPSHLRCTKTTWTSSGLPVNVCNMMTLLYLSYLQMNFQIQRLLHSGDEASPLLNVSVEMVATVLQVGAARERALLLRHDYEFMLLTYGMPSAAVLTSMLAISNRRSQGRNQQQRPKPFPPGLSRSEIIRHLSVLVSHLDSVFPPANANHTIAAQASQTITRVLDEILEAPAPAMAHVMDDDGFGNGGNGGFAGPLTPSESGGRSLRSGMLTASAEAPGLMLGKGLADGMGPEGADGSGHGGGALQGLELAGHGQMIDTTLDPFLGAFEEQGFNEWMSSIDWTAAGSSWGYL